MRPNVPAGLAERIQTQVENGHYASKTEFVNEAIRMRLEEIEK